MAKGKQAARWDDDKTAAENASRHLPLLARAMFRDGAKAVRPGTSKKKLHKFRLKVKRFRYTLELFRPCYGRALEKRISLLKTMQDHLGGVSDHRTARRVIGNLQSPDAAEIARFGDYLDSGTAAETESFRALWYESFDSPEQQRRWTDYLRRFAAPRANSSETPRPAP